MQPLKIYLCDLTHETVILVSDTIPVNIGYVGAFAKKIYGPDIILSLFKYPQSAIEAIKEDPPDILALSNYSWNSHLSEHMAKLVKAINPDVINFPLQLIRWTFSGGLHLPTSITTPFFIRIEPFFFLF